MTNSQNPLGSIPALDASRATLHAPYESVLLRREFDEPAAFDLQADTHLHGEGRAIPPVFVE